MNKVSVKFSAESVSESFARTVVAAYMLPLNPNFEEVGDVKTAVSEAVTNCVVHAYEGKKGDILLEVSVIKDVLHISVTDYGVGIENVNRAVEPFFTTKSEEERSGMGFTVMKTFMDEVTVESEKNSGTTVKMIKRLSEKTGE